MRNLRCYINDFGMLHDRGDVEGKDVSLEALFGVAREALGPGVTHVQPGSPVFEFEVEPDEAVRFLGLMLTLCLFPVFRDEDKPNWAAALATVLESKGLGKTAAEKAVSEQEYKMLCTRLGGGFGDKLYAYLMDSTPENFWEAYTVADLDHRRKMADAANFLNEWGQKGREIAAEKHDAYLNRRPGDRHKWKLDCPGIIPMMQKFGFGLKQWCDERRAKLEAQPKPNPANDGGG